MEDDSDKLDDQARQEWSRHFESLQWGVIGIFTAGVGALFGLSFQNDSTIWAESSGLVLIFVGVFYVAGFRSFREYFHRGIRNRELRAFLLAPRAKGLPRMWDVFVSSFMLVGFAFVYRLGSKLGHRFLITSLGIGVTFPLLGYLWHRGRPTTPVNPSESAEQVVGPERR